MKRMLKAGLMSRLELGHQNVLVGANSFAQTRLHCANEFAPTFIHKGLDKIRGVLLLVLLSLSGAQFSLAEDALNLTPTQLDSLGVRFAAPQAASAAQGSAWSGMVSVPPQGFEQVVATSAGRVLRLEVAAGDTVAASDALLSLFSPDVVTMTQAWQSAKANEALAAQTLAREQRLLKEGIGIERRVREAQTALQQARIEREAAAARLQGAGASLDKSLSSTSEMLIRAPRGGQILSLHALPGAWLGVGEVVASISSTAARWVEADVPVSIANTLQKNQRALVEVAPGESMAGKLLAIGSVVDAARQTVMARVLLEDAATLRPGLRVSLRFDESKAQGLWRVPKSALVQVDGALSVFVKRNDRVLPLAVTNQGMSDAQPAIRAEFAPGDAVAVEGSILLKGAWDGRAASGAE